MTCICSGLIDSLNILLTIWSVVVCCGRLLCLALLYLCQPLRFPVSSLYKLFCSLSVYSILFSSVQVLEALYFYLFPGKYMMSNTRMASLGVSEYRQYNFYTRAVKCDWENLTLITGSNTEKQINILQTSVPLFIYFFGAFAHLKTLLGVWEEIKVWNCRLRGRRY